MKALECPLKLSDIARINFYIARTYFMTNKYELCIERMVIALHLYPENHLYLYNLALAVLKCSNRKIRDAKSTIVDIKNGINRTEYALRFEI